LVGVQEQVPAARASALLSLEQAQHRPVERGGAAAAPISPVAGQGRIVDRRSTTDELMTDNLGPDEPAEVGAAVAVTEHPPILPDRVELAEVAGGDPPFRLVPMGPECPPMSVLPQIVIDSGEHFLGDHAPVIGSPSSDDRVEGGDHRRGVAAT